MLFYVSGAWSSKNSYTEDELRAIHDMDKMLSVIKLRGHVTAQLSAEIDVIAGESRLHIVMCKVCLYFIANACDSSKFVCTMNTYMSKYLCLACCAVTLTLYLARITFECFSCLLAD